MKVQFSPQRNPRVIIIQKLYGKIFNNGFVKQESLSWDDFIENKFGQVYA